MPAAQGKPNRPLWLPNALVGVRLVLAAVFVALLSITEPLLWGPDDPFPERLRIALTGGPNSALVLAAALFILAAITDALDGNLARRWNAVTRFGRVMDPFADKVLVLGAFVCLAGPSFAHELGGDDGRLQASGVHPWMVVLIVGRELLVTSLRGLIEGEGGDFSASLSGKLKMIVQSAAVPLILLVVSLGDWRPGEPARWTIDLLAWAAVVVTVASGVPYVRRAFAPRAAPPEPR